MPHDTYKRPKRDETCARRRDCGRGQPAAETPGTLGSFDTYKCPKRDETERRKDGGAAFLHVGSIAAALLHAARALSVQKRHANERDV